MSPCLVTVTQVLDARGKYYALPFRVAAELVTKGEQDALDMIAPTDAGPCLLLSLSELCHPTGHGLRVGQIVMGYACGQTADRMPVVSTATHPMPTLDDVV